MQLTGHPRRRNLLARAIHQSAESERAGPRVYSAKGAGLSLRIPSPFRMGSPQPTQNALSLSRGSNPEGTTLMLPRELYSSSSIQKAMLTNGCPHLHPPVKDPRPPEGNAWLEPPIWGASTAEVPAGAFGVQINKTVSNQATATSSTM
jgi:hypothetical protein